MSTPLSTQARAEALDDGEVSPAPALLESAQWQRLTDAGNGRELATAWLSLQMSMVAGATKGLVRLAERSRLVTAAILPETGPEPADLRQAAELAITERRPIAQGTAGGSQHVIAVPIEINDRVAGVAALRLDLASSAQIRADLRGAVRQLQWGVAWLREHLRQSATLTAGETADRSRAALDFIAAVLDHDRFRPAVVAAATELAIRFDCARVSIGFARRGSARVAAISHTAQFGKQMKLVRAIGAAMDEAIDQRATILYPVAADAALAGHAHGALSRLQHDGPVLTIPMLVVDRFAGAVTFERSSGESFEPGLVALLDVIVAAIGPILDEKRRNDRWLLVKIAESLGEQVRRLVGPGHVARKLVATAVIAAALFFTVATDTYRVSADALVEGSVRRAVVSAYDGYIQTAPVRAGETVREGDVLATLEDRELALEKLRWTTERQQHVFEYDQALAARQPAVGNVIKAQIDQADAQIRLIDEQIARTRLTAPFDGLVISGDLSQRIGGSVSRGELLFEIAPLTGYRLVMQVDERQIAEIAAGQTGEVVFTSLPDERFTVTVDKITPVASTRDGRNAFQVDGTVSGATDRLRPGMVGVAKVDVAEEKLIAIWLKPMIEWFQMTLWRWIG
jgi:multidrug resistance efflux pump